MAEHMLARGWGSFTLLLSPRVAFVIDKNSLSGWQEAACPLSPSWFQPKPQGLLVQVQSLEPPGSQGSPSLCIVPLGLELQLQSAPPCSEGERGRENVCTCVLMCTCVCMCVHCVHVCACVCMCVHVCASVCVCMGDCRCSQPSTTGT